MSSSISDSASAFSASDSSMRVLMYIKCDAIAINSLATSMSMRLRSCEPGKILLQNRRDADVLNFYFIFAQQKQNDIQRTVKILQRLLRVYYILQVILGLFHALPSVLWNPQNMALGSV